MNGLSGGGGERVMEVGVKVLVGVNEESYRGVGVNGGWKWG